jgi:hypothetical protein
MLCPRLIVLYNGKDEIPDVSQLYLSTAFRGKRTPIELVVTVYNINDGYNEEVKRKCPTLGEYSAFVSMVRKNQSEGMELKKAIGTAVKECIEKNILAEFLEKHKSEVINMLTTEWKLEDAIRVAKGEGEARGIAKGKMEGKAEVLSLMEQGYSLDEIKAKLNQH